MDMTTRYKGGRHSRAISAQVIHHTVTHVAALSFVQMSFDFLPFTDKDKVFSFFKSIFPFLSELAKLTSETKGTNGPTRLFLIDSMLNKDTLDNKTSQNAKRCHLGNNLDLG